MEPTRQEKQFLKEQRAAVEEYKQAERRKEALKRREQVKELFCMVQTRKPAAGPNPLSVKRRSKGIKKKKAEKPRRKRKGKRSKALSLQREMERAATQV